ncbi:MAG: YigZ family protein [Bacteroidales bacterium]
MKRLDSYKTIVGPVQGLYKEKGSKFLAFAFAVDTVEKAQAQITQIKKDYFDARHHCYAYVLGANKETYRYNDDSEPSGTAGRPIYGQILSKDLSCVLVVVVRYFGGTKLGTSGLIQAYKLAAADALEQAVIIEKQVMQNFHLQFSYEKMNAVMKLIKEENLTQQKCTFDQICELNIAVRLSDTERICRILNTLEVSFLAIS